MYFIEQGLFTRAISHVQICQSTPWTFPLTRRAGCGEPHVRFGPRGGCKLNEFSLCSLRCLGIPS